MPIRVLHVLESLGAGGIETTFLNALRSMRAASADDCHDVLAFAGGLLEPGYRAAAGTVHLAADTNAIARILDRRYDVIHLLFERCASRILPYALGHLRTAVVYGKGYDFGGTLRLNDKLQWGADEAMLAACDGITFTTPQLAAGFLVPGGRTSILRKAADVRRFNRIAHADATTPMRVLCVANLHPCKRIEDLLRAHVQVRRRVDAELRIVGAGSDHERSRLESLADDLGIAGSFALVRAHTDIPRELAEARVFALASASEGVPTVILEAMAAARPIVATRVGHVASIVDNGVEGFLVNACDPAALADRIAALLTDPLLARRMGVAGRARAAHHDVSAVSLSLLDALRTAAAGTAAPVSAESARSVANLA